MSSDFGLTICLKNTEKRSGRKHKQNMQKKWEEMYKSIEKSKSREKEDSKLKSLEEKLKHIKRLRYQDRISEQEYQERKEKLLNRL